jgi:hypothetical protein
MRFWPICILALLPLTASAQGWSSSRSVEFDSIPPYSIMGFFNPSYCEEDSLLYFDAFMRGLLEEGGVIYTSKYEREDDYPIYIWTNTEEMPAPINIPGYINVMPDISPSGDTLFFCSNRPGTRGGSDIWMSVKTDSLWSDPVNLGDSINTPVDEYAPDYSPASRILFFDRYDTLNNHSMIFSSHRLDDSAWCLASPLPEVINIPGHDNFSPTYDENGQALYYSSIVGLSTEPVYRSYYSDGEWGTPAALGDSVNGFPHNLCPYGTTENPDITASGTRLFYNTMIGGGLCIDYYSYLFYSEALPEAIEERANGKLTINLEVYPNPSNSHFLFRLTGQHDIDHFRIYDIGGRFIKQIDFTETTANWDCTDFRNRPVSSGVYFAIFIAGDRLLSKKLTYLQ